MSFGPALAAFIRATVGPLFGYGFHPAAVVSQASDGSVEVKPDSPVVPPQKGVPLVLGVPGVKVKVGPGTRVRLSFAGGSPGASEVALWEGDGLLELEMDASVKVVVKAPAVHLGGDTPPDAALLGTTYRTADASFDNALAAAATTFTAATVPIASTLAPFALPATPPSPADGKAVGAQVIALLTALNALSTAINAAASAKEAGSATYLSNIVKVKG